MVKQQLLEMLQDLGQEDLKTFQWHLQDHDFLGGFQEIKRIKLEKADTRETVDVMIETYTSEHAVDVAKLILKKMHLNEELTRLSKNMELSRITPCPPEIRKTPSPPPFRKDFLADQKLRSELMKYSCQLKVDINTLSSVLKLSDNNRKVTNVEEDQKYPDHTDRFDGWAQLLCRNNLCDRQYWEVEWRGNVILSVSYSSIRRKGDSNASVFGMNDKSWSLECSDTGYTVYHKERDTPVSTSSVSNRVAVYVDYPTGTLSFYRVSSDTLIELYTFNTTFTEPLYPGFGVWAGSSVFLCRV